MRHSLFCHDKRSVDWYLVTDVSGQPIGFIFKGQAAQSWKLRNA